MDIKLEIAKLITIEGKNEKEIKELISFAPSNEMGDYALPCFSMAKEKKISPQIIAKEIQSNLVKNNLIKKTEIAGGYLNFFLNRKEIAKMVLKESVLPSFFCENLGKNKIACIEYSSVNLAKFMHIGHYNCTILGECIARLHEFLGYKVIRINYLGDYGTPFGKMVLAFQMWGKKEDIEKEGVAAIQKLYIRFNQEERDELLEKARAVSKKIEEKEGEEYLIYKWFIEISTKEAKKIIERLGIKFDDWRGESTYNKQLKNIVAELKEKGLAKNSEGAVIVDLSDVGYGVAVVERKDGGSLYLTRDLVAIEDRFNLYNFDKHIYVTGLAQNQHFENIFEICKRLKRPYAKKLQHIGYGIFSMPEGKIASRFGKQAILEEILEFANKKAREIISGRKFSIEDEKKVADVIAQGAMAFSILKIETIKDKVFDLKSAISFDGDTAPYIQYTYARCCSLLRKRTLKEKEISNFSFFENINAFTILKEINNFKQTIIDSYKNNEPCYIARSILNIAKNFNAFYNNGEKIISSENENEKLALVTIVQKTLKLGLNLLCIETLEEM